MTLQASGQISASEINTETRRSSTDQLSFDSMYSRFTSKVKTTLGTQVSFSNFYSGTYCSTVVAYGGANTPFIHAYSWSQGHGTKYSNPSTLPPQTIGGLNINFGAGSNDSNSNDYSKTFKKSVIGAVHGSSTNRYTAFYPWSDATGFGSRYTLTGSFPTSNPTTITGGEVIIFDDSGTSNVVIIGGGSTTPNTVAWAWDDATGFGTKYADPATATPDASAIQKHVIGGQRFNSGFFQLGDPEEFINIIFAALSTSADRLSAWYFGHTTGWGTRYSDPATLPTGSVSSIICNGNDEVIGTQSSTGTNEKRSFAYTFSESAGWGTRFAAMSALDISSASYSCSQAYFDISKPAATNAVVFGMQSSPYVVAIDWTPGLGWGTKFSDPASLPPGDASSAVNWNFDLDVSVGHKISPYVTTYAWSSTGWGTKYSNPATLPSGDIQTNIFF